MTVSSSTDRALFPGNDVTTVFPLPFRFFDNADISASLIDLSTLVATPLTLGVHYSLAGAGEPEDDGNAASVLTMFTPPASTESLFVIRTIPLTQPTDIVNQGRFFPEIHENVFDRLVMQIQQVDGLASNSMQLDPTGQTWDARGSRIVNVADPVGEQDATTLLWVQQYVGQLLTIAQGSANNAANVLFVDGDGIPTTVQKGVIKQFSDAASMQAKAGDKDGEQCLLLGYYDGAPGIGGGTLYWRAGDVGPVDNGTRFAAPGGVWERPLGKAVFLEWFGILGDGVTLEDAKVRAAVAATPDGGTLFMPVREMTVLMDIPSGQSNRWQAAVNCNKPGMRVLGSHACTFKLKDFTSAYVSYVGVSGLGAFRASASDVEISGLNIDANADHHYEVDGGLVKWFEGGGPSGKRPPAGILVTVDDNAANVSGVRIKGNKVFRPLSGVYVAGNLSLVGGTSLDDLAFFTKTLATNTVVDCVVEGNEISYAKGNDVIFITGVRDSIMRENISRNSMYHNFRFYAGVESCLMEDNKAYMNYAEIAARWNQTDLGYWRNDNPADPANYLIQRAGYLIGSTAAQTSANSGNVRRCSAINNRIWYSSNTETGSIVDTSQPTLASYFVWQVTNGIIVDGNESHNSPFQGLAYSNSILALNPTAQGVLFKNNVINNCAQEFISTLGTGPVFTENAGVNCGVNGSGRGIIRCQGGGKIYKNDLIWQRPTVNANTVIVFVTYGTNGDAFISDNLVQGYTGARISKAGSDIIHGSDGGGVPLTILAGWTAGAEPLLLWVDCSGYARLHGRIVSAAAGSDTFASLNGTFQKYRPSQNVRFPVWQTATPGVVLGQSTTAGSLIAARGALAAGTSFDVTMAWQIADFKL